MIVHASQLPKEEGCFVSLSLHTAETPPFGKGGVFILVHGRLDCLKLVNANTGEMIAQQVMEARTFGRRLRGLLFTKLLPSGSCLHIEPCRSVHTFFMQYAIDIVYLDKQHRVVGVEECLLPGRVGAVFKGAASVVELPAGSISLTRTAVGQTVQFI
jgi:uncharacterized protein